ncbi:DNA polymerase III subunit delta' [Thioclava litoralis]|uniref:DNA polymerase III subunit delta n=1 Tax=Thioclava litoralis TaxID=3076557 RepID=A0ABZ1E225_9RHOB|nr:DNA polymerase III subunit delta' [Thioclava sp. FTW29]
MAPRAAKTEPGLPDPSCIEGAPHPRMAEAVFGQSKAEAEFLEAFRAGRLHHGWLLTGPRGIGKATFAWRIAKFLMSQPEAGGMFVPEPPETLNTDPDHAAVRRIMAGSEPGVFELKRGPNATGSALSQDIRVDRVREMRSFLHLSASDGGPRVVIVDCADEMNTQAANALLKLLEEPPERVTFLMISHQPAGLLPTIRSRCRELRLHALDPEAMAQALDQAEAMDPDVDMMALSALSAGSVGEAIRLINLGGLETYAQIVDLMATLPRLDRPKALALAESFTGRQNAERFDLALGLLDLFMARLARAGVMGPPHPEGAQGEAKLMARLSPDQLAAMKWAALHQELGTRARHGRAVNLDPAALVVDMVLKLTAAAA